MDPIPEKCVFDGQYVIPFPTGIYFGQVVPRIGAALSNGAAYRYLPRSVAYLPEPAEMLASLERQGFVNIRRRLLTSGISQLISATWKLPE